MNPPRPLLRIFTSPVAAVAAALLATACSDETLSPLPLAPRLDGFASLPAATFEKGPTSGAFLGPDPINGEPVPFTDKQPVQGFSAVVDRGDGTFLCMSDNGFGKIENSADYNLRVYTVRPDFRNAKGGAGTIAVESFIELSDPDKLVPFAIVNHFSQERVLTGADFDIESMQQAKDGSLWFGDEFGPFLLHTDATGKLLDAPIPLPDLDGGEGAQIRSPQSPFLEEGSTLRVMNALRAHAIAHGNKRTPVFSPYYVLLKDDDAATFVSSRKDPPVGSGVTEASSEIFDVKSLQAAGYPIVTWTVDTTEQMKADLKLGVNGIISDRPDLLYAALKDFDANGDGKPGDYLDVDGLVDTTKFDAQGHRGGRDLRPENTLPAFEVALDNLMSTLELDNGITKDGVPVISHDPHVQAQKCRRTDGMPYNQADEVLIKDLTVAELQSTYICDKVFRGPQQVNVPTLSPVAVQFKSDNAMPDIYVMPKLEQLFAFVTAYIEYYKNGAGKFQDGAGARVKNAERVRFNIETKVNPRAEYAERTIAFDTFAETVASTIQKAGMVERADVQSFDFRTLLYVQEHYPAIRTVYLWGDFPRFADPTIAGTDDGTNMQDEDGKPTPWLAGLYWPYRKTTLGAEHMTKPSGGFEGMALSPDGATLLPILEHAVDGDDPKSLRIHAFDVAAKQYTGGHYTYTLDQGISVTDFILTDKTHGMVIERDDTQGDLKGHKTIYEIKLGKEGSAVEKKLSVDLLKIDDRAKLAGAGQMGDVGLGATFAFPFQTIEAIVHLDNRRIGVLNDNNFPFSVGRHLGSSKPDDTEFIIIDVGHDLDKW